MQIWQAVLLFAVSAALAAVVYSTLGPLPGAPSAPMPYVTFAPDSLGVRVYAWDASDAPVSQIYYIRNGAVENVTAGYGYVGRAACGDRVELLYRYGDGRAFSYSGRVLCSQPRKAALSRDVAYDAAADVLGVAVETLNSGVRLYSFIQCAGNYDSPTARLRVYIAEPVAVLRGVTLQTRYGTYSASASLGRLGYYTVLTMNVTGGYGGGNPAYGDKDVYNYYARLQVGVRPKAGVGSDFDAFRNVTAVATAFYNYTGDTKVLYVYLNGTLVGTCKYQLNVVEQNLTRFDVNITAKSVYGVVETVYCGFDGRLYKTSALWYGDAMVSVTMVNGTCSGSGMGFVIRVTDPRTGKTYNKTVDLPPQVALPLIISFNNEAWYAKSPNGTLGDFLYTLYQRDPTLPGRLLFTGAYVNGSAILQEGDPYKRSMRTLVETVRITTQSTGGSTNIVEASLSAVAVPGFWFGGTMGIAPFRTVNATKLPT